MTRLEKIGTIAGIALLNIYPLPAIVSIFSGNPSTMPAASHLMLAGGIMGTTIRLIGLREWLLATNNILGVVIHLVLASFALAY